MAFSFNRELPFIGSFSSLAKTVENKREGAAGAALGEQLGLITNL
jgi:hypothetical protein